jgi:hypothetical protein
MFCNFCVLLGNSLGLRGLVSKNLRENGFQFSSSFFLEGEYRVSLARTRRGRRRMRQGQMQSLHQIR